MKAEIESNNLDLDEQTFEVFSSNRAEAKAFAHLGSKLGMSLTSIIVLNEP
jgi:hypothetical protein